MVHDVPDGVPVVGRAAYRSREPTATVHSLIDVVNSLFQGLLTADEVGDRPLVHYYLDYYVSQVLTGGHSQFLANSLGVNAARIMTLVQQGIENLAVTPARDIWGRFVAAATALSPDELDAFVRGYVDEQGFHVLGPLRALDSEFRAGVASALEQANAHWLRGRPELVVLDDADLPRYAAARSARIPNLSERQREARAQEPSFVQAARAYCDERGLNFEQVCAGKPAVVDGVDVIDWAFLADRRLFSLIELPDGRVQVTELSRRTRHTSF
jgi:hypothetical protein